MKDKDIEWLYADDIIEIEEGDFEKHINLCKDIFSGVLDELSRR